MDYQNCFGRIDSEGGSMGVIATLCIIAMVIGVVFIVLGVLAPTARYVPNGVAAGIALLVIGAIVYLVVLLLGGAGV